MNFATEVDLNINDKIFTECDCLQNCLDRSDTCVAWVWKFTGDPSKARTCTLYSNFNLPPSVTIAFNVSASINIEKLQAANNPQVRFPYLFQSELTKSML